MGTHGTRLTIVASLILSFMYILHSWKVNSSQHEGKTLEVIDTCLESKDKVWKSLKHSSGYKSKLIIVAVITREHVDPIAADILQNYAELQGYEFKLHVIDVNEWNQTPYHDRTLHFFSARWRVVQEYVLAQEYEWILALDLDNLVANPRKSMEPFLSLNENVVFHVRENHQVAAGAVLFRTTAFSWCFLQHWISLGWEYPEPLYDTDNGDLIDMLLDLIDPSLASSCKLIRLEASSQGSYESFVRYTHCFQNSFLDLKKIHQRFPIKILFPHEGFWRTLRGNNQSFFERRDKLRSFTGYDNNGNPINMDKSTAIVRDAFFTCAYPTDLFVHNKRDFREAWKASTVRDKLTQQLLEGCSILTDENELQLCKKCCYYDYPGCIKNGRNVCYEQPHCRNLHFSQRWNPECDDLTGVD